MRDQHDLALEEREPAVLLGLVVVCEQPVGVSEPALRHRVVAPEHDRVVRQPRRGASGRARIAAAAIGPERARPCVQARVTVAQEPRRLRPALERLGHLPVRERALERRPGLVPFAAAERLEAGRQIASARNVADTRLGSQLERRILVEDLALQLTELYRRFEAELVVEAAAEVVVDRERVGVPAGPVEREHPLPVQALTQREPRDLGLQLTDQLCVAALHQLRLDAILETHQAQLVEMVALDSREGLAELGERLAAPEPEGVAQPRGRGRRLARLERRAARCGAAGRSAPRRSPPGRPGRGSPAGA